MKFLLLLLAACSLNVLGQTWQNFSTSNSGIPSEMVNSIAVGTDNEIWFATDAGVSVFHEGNWTNYADSLTSAKVNELYFLASDDQDVVFAATDSGLTYFGVAGMEVVSVFVHLTQADNNLAAERINAALADNSNLLWMGTDAGVSLDDGRTILNIDGSTDGIDLYSNIITDIAVGYDTVIHRGDEYVPPAGVIYLATDGGGVGRLYNHDADAISSASVVENTWSGLPSDDVLTVHVDHMNNHWYGTTAGAAYHLGHESKRAHWHIFTEVSGLIDNYVTAIETDTLGNAWFGTRSGLSQYNGETWVSYTEDDGLVSNLINDVKIDKSGAVWIATDNGVSRYGEATSIADEMGAAVPGSYEIELDVYPNPFNPETTIRVTARQAAELQLSIYDISGKLVETVADEYIAAGEYEYRWDAQNAAQSVSSGIYFLTAETGRTVKTAKIILLK